MSITRYVELIVGGLLLAAVLLLGFTSCTQRRALEAKTEEASVATGDAEAYRTYNKGSKEIAAKKEIADAAMDEALKRNQEWADEPVPADVADLLCHDPDAACRADQEVSDN